MPLCTKACRILAHSFDSREFNIAILLSNQHFILFSMYVTTLYYSFLSRYCTNYITVSAVPPIFLLYISFTCTYHEAYNLPELLM